MFHKAAAVNDQVNNIKWEECGASYLGFYMTEKSFLCSFTDFRLRKTSRMLLFMQQFRERNQDYKIRVKGLFLIQTRCAKNMKSLAKLHNSLNQAALFVTVTRFGEQSILHANLE